LNAGAGEDSVSGGEGTDTINGDNGMLKPGKPGKLGKTGQLKFAGKGAGLLHSLGVTTPEPVEIVVEMGGQRFCSEFGGIPQFTPGFKFKAKDAPAPADCP